MYQSIVIGAGISGIVTARELAEKQNKKVLVIEKRNHIGGNAYDQADANGVLVHPYGPHIFHTDDEGIFSYFSRFTKWYLYGHEVTAKVKGQYLPVPFNLNTLEIVYGREQAKILEHTLIESYGMGTKVPILTLREHEDRDIQKIAEFVYENIYLYYTMKQWGQKPEQIDPAVTARVPIHISRDNRYFQDKYQGVPADGYHQMFEAMLSHQNISLLLNTDSSTLIHLKEDGIYYQNQLFEGEVIYTGPADELFAYQYGRLPYRTLEFQFEHYKQDSYQPNNVVNYTVDQDYTRITEYKKLTGQKVGRTTISKEYPYAYTGKKGETPYYPINNKQNNSIYQKYLLAAEKYNNLYLLGRLAKYQYYNMDTMAAKALELSEQIRNKERG